MDRLNVRSLSGLNLREALESLRRQLLRDGELPTEASQAPTPRATPMTREAELAPARTVSGPPASPVAATQFFDEEEEFELGDVEDDVAAEVEESLHEMRAATSEQSVAGEGRPSLPDDEDFEYDYLDEVPDFEALAGPEPARPLASGHATGGPAASHPSAPSPMPAKTSGTLAAPEHARALQRIGQLRGAEHGSAATPYQRNAYKNLVLSQLSETEATTLVRGIWRLSPAQLSGDQLDALVRWAKEDTFAEDAQLVLAALQAERARASAEGVSGGAGEAPRRTPPARRAGGTRSEPAGGR
jgi:hypothetical protein